MVFCCHMKDIEGFNQLKSKNKQGGIEYVMEILEKIPICG